MPNFNSVNSKPVNGQPAEIPLGDFEGGVIVQFEQNVVNIASGEIVEIEQIVDFRATAEGTIVTFEQQVLAKADAQNIVVIEQTVKNQADIGKCFVSDWDLVLTINGAEIPKDQIIGRMEVLRSENDAALLTFQLKPPVGIQDPYVHQGKRVTLDVVQGTSIRRIYTGIVDYPTYNIVGETVNYSCTDRRRELVNSQLKTAVKSIGYYSVPIFGEPLDTADELDKRLTTVPISVDFDAYGNYTVSSLFAKTTPDYVISSSDIFRRTPRVELASRARLINKVTFNMEYRYSRLHQRRVGFRWIHPAKDRICLFLEERYSLPSRAMIAGAAGGSGWDVTGEIVFEPVWPGGWYKCTSGTIGWQPQSITGGNVVADTDQYGNVVTDSNGNTQYKVEGATIENTGSLFCLEAGWSASKRWSQTLSEKYSVTLTAPQSIARYGVIEQERNYGVESEYDDGEFENVKGYSTNFGKLDPYVKPAPANTGVYIDYRDNAGEFNESFLVASNIAKTTILSSHRDNRIILEVPLTPEYDLKHTIEVSSNKIDGRGKISQVRHIFDISNKEAFTEVELSLSTALGSASDSVITVPGAPEVPTDRVYSVGLGNWFGIEPNESMTGMIGNKVKFGYTGGRNGLYMTEYPESFVVKGPDVPDSLRNAISGSASAAFTVALQNDPFEIAFIGDCG